MMRSRFARFPGFLARAAIGVAAGIVTTAIAQDAPSPRPTELPGLTIIGMGDQQRNAPQQADQAGQVPRESLQVTCECNCPQQPASQAGQAGEDRAAEPVVEATPAAPNEAVPYGPEPLNGQQ